MTKLSREEEIRRREALKRFKHSRKAETHTKALRDNMRPCPTGKVPYPSLEIADVEAYKVNLENRQMSAVPATSYKCRVCQRWHIGRDRNRGFGVE